MTLKHIQTVWKRGKPYRYLRLPGKARVKLPDLPMDDPAFLAAYAAATASPARVVRATAGTLAHLIEAFLASPAYRDLGTGYRAIIRRHADAIRDLAGEARAAHLKPAHIRADMARLDPHPANARLKAWRLICAHGVAAGLLAEDPTEAVHRRKTGRSEGNVPWTADEIARYRARWPIDSAARRCMELLLWTGARISDAAVIGPGHVGKDGVLSFRQSKTGKPAFVPWTCALPDFADPSDHALLFATLAHAPRQMTFLATRTGSARSVKALGTLIAKAAAAAEIEKSAHGLRKARAVALAEGGATTHQIASWTGHTSLKEVDHYTTATDRRKAVTGTVREQISVNRADIGTLN